MTHEEFAQVINALRRTRAYLEHATNTYIPEGLFDEVDGACDLMEMQMENDFGRRCLDDLCDELYEAERDAA